MIDREVNLTQDLEDRIVMTTVIAMQVARDLLPDSFTAETIQVVVTEGEVAEAAAAIMRAVAEKEMGDSASGYEDLKDKSWLLENDLPLPTEHDVRKAEAKADPESMVLRHESFK